MIRTKGRFNSNITSGACYRQFKDIINTIFTWPNINSRRQLHLYPDFNSSACNILICNLNNGVSVSSGTNCVGLLHAGEGGFFTFMSDNVSTSSSPQFTTTWVTPLSYVLRTLLLGILSNINSGRFVFTINALSLYTSNAISQ